MANKVSLIPHKSLTMDMDFNARKDYNKKKLSELKTSIEQYGLLQPIGVCKNTGDTAKYDLVYGFRRLLAITQIREEMGPDAYEKIPCVVLEGTLDELRALNKIENLEREDLSPAEVAMSIKKMVTAGMPQRTIAAKLGRPQSWVSYHYKVASKLVPEAWEAFERGDLTLEHALNIAQIPEDKQAKVTKQVVNANTRGDARKAAKEAARESGTKRVYANAGRPTAKNLVKLVSDISFDATAEKGVSKLAFYNGYAAGLRVALGREEVSAITPAETYLDVDYHTRTAPAPRVAADKKAAKKAATKAPKTATKKATKKAAKKAPKTAVKKAPKSGAKKWSPKRKKASKA